MYESTHYELRDMVTEFKPLTGWLRNTTRQGKEVMQIVLQVATSDSEECRPEILDLRTASPERGLMAGRTGVAMMVSVS